MKKLLLITSLLATIGIISVAISPYVALLQIKNALNTGNSVKMSEYVNYQKLQNNLTLRLNKNIPVNNNTIFGGLVKNLSNIMTAKIIETIITPENVMKVLIKENEIVTEIKSRKSSAPKTGVENNNNNIKYGYESFNSFYLVVVRNEKESFQVKLERENLIEWKIVDFTTPFVND
jgi:hypothetical protein